MSKEKRQSSQLPKPPAIARKFQLHLLQMIGMPLMMLIPILALLGVFGETIDSVIVSNSMLEMRVKYPTRFRYKMIDSVRVSLSNTSAQSIPTIQVKFDQAYIEGFSEVAFTPTVQHITDSAYVVEITDLQPGETRTISVTIQAERYGKHEGRITATAKNGPGLQVSVATFTFP